MARQSRPTPATPHPHTPPHPRYREVDETTVYLLNSSAWAEDSIRFVDLPDDITATAVGSRSGDIAAGRWVTFNLDPELTTLPTQQGKKASFVSREVTAKSGSLTALLIKSGADVDVVDTKSGADPPPPNTESLLDGVQRGRSILRVQLRHHRPGSKAHRGLPSTPPPGAHPRSDHLCNHRRQVRWVLLVVRRHALLRRRTGVLRQVGLLFSVSFVLPQRHGLGVRHSFPYLLPCPLSRPLAAPVLLPSHPHTYCPAPHRTLADSHPTALASPIDPASVAQSN